MEDDMFSFSFFAVALLGGIGHWLHDQGFGTVTCAVGAGAFYIVIQLTTKGKGGGDGGAAS